MSETKQSVGVNGTTLPAKYKGTYLIEETPVSFQPSLAVALGVNEAILCQQIHWLGNTPLAYSPKNKRKELLETKTYNGRTFVRVEPQQLLHKQHGHFRFWSMSTFKRTVAEAKKLGVLLTETLNSDAWDQTNWYAIDYARLAEIEADHAESSTPIQNDTMHRLPSQNEPLESVNLTTAPIQNEPIESVTMSLTYKEDKKTTKGIKEQQQQQQIVEASPVVDDSRESFRETQQIAQQLTKAGYSPAQAALEVASEYPAACVAWLQNIQGKNLKNPGGYLRKHILSGEMPSNYSPPVPDEPPHEVDQELLNQASVIWKTFTKLQKERLRADFNDEWRMLYKNTAFDMKDPDHAEEWAKNILDQKTQEWIQQFN